MGGMPAAVIRTARRPATLLFPERSATGRRTADAIRTRHAPKEKPLGGIDPERPIQTRSDDFRPHVHYRKNQPPRQGPCRLGPTYGPGVAVLAAVARRRRAVVLGERTDRPSWTAWRPWASAASPLLPAPAGSWPGSRPGSAAGGRPPHGRFPAAARARVTWHGGRPPAGLLDRPGPPVPADRVGNPPARPVIGTDLDMFRPGRGLPGRSWRPWRPCGAEPRARGPSWTPWRPWASGRSRRASCTNRTGVLTFGANPGAPLGPWPWASARSRPSARGVSWRTSWTPAAPRATWRTWRTVDGVVTDLGLAEVLAPKGPASGLPGPGLPDAGDVRHVRTFARARPLSDAPARRGSTWGPAAQASLTPATCGTGQQVSMTRA